MIGTESEYYKTWNSNYYPYDKYTFSIPIGESRFFDIPDGVTGGFPVPHRSRAASDALLNW